MHTKQTDITSDKLNILYVEDDEDDYIIVRDILRNIEDVDYDLTWVDNFNDACERIENNKYDIYIFDYFIGADNGLELFRKFFKDVSFAPVIMLTGQGERDLDMNAMHSGIADFLDKRYLNPALLERSIRYTYMQSKFIYSIDESRSFFQSVLDSLSSHIAVLNENGTIVAVNESWRKFARDNGLEMKDYGIGSNYFNVCATDNGLYDEDCSEINDGIRKVMSGEIEKYEFEYPCHSPTEKRWFVLHVTKFSHGEPIRIILSHENITRRKLMEIERNNLIEDLGERVKELSTLHSTSKLLQDEESDISSVMSRLIEIIPDGFLYPDKTEARISYGDHEFSTPGFRPAEQKLIREFTDLAGNKGFIELVILDKQPERYEGPFLKEETELLNSVVEMLRVYINNRNSRITLQKNLSYITKMHNYEEIIRTVTQGIHSTINLQDVLNSAVNILITKIENVDNISIYTIHNGNALLRAYRGYPQWYNERLMKIPQPEGKTWEVIRQGKTRYIQDTEEDNIICDTGREVGTKSYLSLPLKSDGEVIGCLHVHSLLKDAFDEEEINLFEVVTRQIEVAFKNARQAEELRENKEKYQTLFEQSPIGVFIFDKNMIIRDCNMQLSNITKAPRDQIIGLNLKKLNDQKFVPYLESVLDGESGYFEGFYKTTISNIELWLSMQFSPMRDMEGEVTGGMAVLEDISERVESERKIREQANLLDKARDAIEVRDLDHNIVFWNRSAELLYGWEKEEVLGRNVCDLLYDKNSVSQLKTVDKTLLEKGEWNGELVHITKDKRKITVDSSWTLVRDEQGNAKSILIVKSDVTDKKNFEAQLLRAQRMESIGTLAGGIAHDLNNVLQPIMLTTELLKSKNLNESNKHLFSTLESSATRAASLVNQVLSFSRGMEGEKVQVQLRHIIKEIEGVIRETFPRSIVVNTNIQKDLSLILGDSTRLHQVIMNMCINARDAMPEGGTLTINAKNFYADENYSEMNLEANTGHYVVIMVADNGTGIPKENINKIFEPFFTTKELNKGTGLGLSTAFGIVKNHGGFIRVYSEIDKGSEFRIYLPATDTDEKVKSGEDETADLPRGNGELILVVDDEESVRNITKLTLESNGYTVIVATDGAEAISLYNKNKEDVELVIMDMMMPVLSGISSISVLRKLNPKVKIIASTGLEEQLNKFGGDNEPEPDAILPKPYTSDKLLNVIHKVLE